MKLQKDMFVKFTDKDESGRYSYIGQIVSVGQMIEFQTEHGLMAVPSEEAGKFSPAKQPPDWKQPKPVAQKTETPRRSGGGGSKRDQVEKLVQDNPTLSRKELIALAVEQIGMTEAGASTYVSQARKKLK